MSEKERLIELIKRSLMKHIDKSCKLADNIANDLLVNLRIILLMTYITLHPDNEFGIEWYTTKKQAEKALQGGAE